MTTAREPLPTRVQDTPPLPPEYAAALDDGLDALGLSLTPTRRAVIDGHVRLLVAWTSAINLTAIREPRAIAVSHVLDSLTAVSFARDRGATAVLDLGSGGGFPGIPMATALGAERALLVEPIAKKARFLETVVEATGVGGTVAIATTRAESIGADPRQRGTWPLVTARAVAPMADLVELAFPLLERGGSLLAWKRGDIEDELHAAERAARALGGGRFDTVDIELAGLEGHLIVVATRTGVVPDVYPRDPATRRRRPW